ncbi:MAG: phosphoglycerate kinase [Candidatus Spechtbacteria bacterium RIFCSPLOWO2_01_FULL_43_12]|uniref:Phosphoglycerate kinase n=1 Tax=Candidatus Spechtbacteria bacterium RIFCSPLOWO2_01_FULL_43_12 TaxID=1802162 RepID=A0A1G2HFB8_9BACT|nr:MAG: phosphoglycerate kinase [Candidatus Spechtbacteria bacterium RIFCSPLOWO2_01_FULL_43_12]
MRLLESLKIEPDTRVILRTDYNVSVVNGKVQDDFRIKSSLQTIEYLLERKAKIIIMSHMGRPKGRDRSLSLKPIAEHLGILLDKKVLFFGDVESALSGIEDMRPGDVAMLENLRFFPGEEASDKKFAHELSKLGDVYVDDAFAVAHRKHTSVFLLPRLLPPAAGFLIQKEVSVLDDILLVRKPPVVFILGGAKVETKVKIFVKLLHKLDAVCVGGLLANSILAAKGIAVGKSRYEDIEQYVEEFDITDKRLHLPLDVIVSKDPSGRSPVRTAAIGDVKNDEIILDAGPDTVKLFSKVIEDAGTVVWNGPLGAFEVKKFGKATRDLAKELKNTGARVIVGGGDLVRAIHEAGAEKSIYYQSTGGGAMLEYLAEGTLPALEVLQ